MRGRFWLNNPALSGWWYASPSAYSALLCEKLGGFMEVVNVYSDGKIGRATKAKIIKAGSKRLLIKFYDRFEEEEKTVWFDKIRREGGGVYCHAPSNTWFYRYREADAFKKEIKDCITQEYYRELFGA